MKREREKVVGGGEVQIKHRKLAGPARVYKDLSIRATVDRLKVDVTKVMVEQPKEIAFMTRNKMLEWKYQDRTGYETFRMPGKDMFPLDLKQGFEEFEATYKVPKPDSLEHVLKAVKESGYTYEAAKKPKFVAWRGILSKLMCTPYLPRDTYEIALWKYKGVIYMSNRETAEKMEKDRNMSRRDKMFMYYGYKFEEVCTRPESAPKIARPTDPRECFCRIFKTKIGNNYVIGAGEMDCYDPKRNNMDMELKVTRLLENDKHIRSFERYKLLKFYCQSFLAGVLNVLVGFRDDDGNVHKTQILETLKIPHMVKGREHFLWDSKVCVKFLDLTLNWLDHAIPDCEHEDMNATDIYTLSSDGAGMLILQSAPRTPDEYIEHDLYL